MTTTSAARNPRSRKGVPVTSAKRWYRMEIANEDSVPLVVRRVYAEVATRQIVFRTVRGGPHRLFVGDPKAVPPHYDLHGILAEKEELLPRSREARG